MNSNLEITRRKLLKLLGWILIIPLTGMVDSMVRREAGRNPGKVIGLRMTDIPEGFSEHPDFFLYLQGDRLAVYSRKCSHLGCRVRKGGHETMQCPCHGSEFSLNDGKPVHGPANQPLTQLEYTIHGDVLKINVPGT